MANDQANSVAGSLQEIWNQEVEFLRRSPLVLLRKLGQGACGMTVLAQDPDIGVKFVCKKFQPADNWDLATRARLYQGFVTEIAILYELQHRNVVRMFHHYLYTQQQRAYILMEYIDGVDLAASIKRSPDSFPSLFGQAVDAFAYLHSKKVLHRDVRPSNLLVGADGTLKVIDFGFGKKVEAENFDRSVSLNWSLGTPVGLTEGRYSFATDIYFLGAVFRDAAKRASVAEGPLRDVLDRMCMTDPADRCRTMEEVSSLLSMSGNTRGDIKDEFSKEEATLYRRFADYFENAIHQLPNDVKMVDDPATVREKLASLVERTQLEQYVRDTGSVLAVLLTGSYVYTSRRPFPVELVRAFHSMLYRLTDRKVRVILSHLFQRVSHRITKVPLDDIPF